MTRRVDSLLYIHLAVGAPPPQLEPAPCRVVIIAEQAVPEDWRNHISDWVIRQNCLYMMAWGTDCPIWHDAIDWSLLEMHEFGEISDDGFVMTTQHEDEDLEEAFFYCHFVAHHPTIDLDRVILLDICEHERRKEILARYESALDESYCSKMERAGVISRLTDWVKRSIKPA